MSGEGGLLRDPAEALLNDLLARTRRACDLYERLAGEAEPALGGLFRELASEHRARSRELEREVRARGALPMDVDPDAETLEQTLARLRAAVAGVAGDPDRERALDRLRAEEALAAALAEASPEDLSSSARETLERLRRTVEQARLRLAEYAERDAG